MTKLLALRSIERGIQRAFAILGERGVEQAIEATLGLSRSASLIRKCGDPDDESHHLQMRYAVALDRACYERVRQRPLLEAYQNLTEEGPTGPERRSAEMVEILEAVVILQAALGDLAHLVELAFSEQSSAPDALTPAERRQIVEAVEELEKRAALFKADLIRRD